MALHWDLSGIKDNDTVCYTREGDECQVKGTTECIIWMSMFIDMGNWTAKAMPEVWRRVKVYEEVLGAVRVRYTDHGSLPCPLTMDEVLAHQGLSTNVINTTARQFNAKLEQSAVRKCKERTRRALTQAKESLAQAEAAALVAQSTPTEHGGKEVRA